MNDLEEQVRQLERGLGALLTSEGKPKPGKEEEVEALNRQIMELRSQMKGHRKESPEKERGLEKRRQVKTQPSPTVGGASVQVKLDLLRKVFVLGGRRGVQHAVVPIGSVFVLAYDYETTDEGGLPEIYLEGETVRKDPLRKDARCEVVELAEFPGRIRFYLTRPLVAISRSEEDVATLEAEYVLCLREPIRFLRRARGQWHLGKDPDRVNQEIAQDLERQGEGILHASGLRLWSGDESKVFADVLAALNGYLGQIGLGAEEVYVKRVYPLYLHEIALQFARVERAIRYEIEVGWSEDLAGQVGFSRKELEQIAASTEQEGATFFEILTRAQPEVKQKAAEWINREIGARAAADFIKELYSGRHEEREVKLSEQVVRWAIRNPMLTVGEWLEKKPSEPTLFQRLESRIEKPRFGG